MFPMFFFIVGWFWIVNINLFTTQKYNRELTRNSDKYHIAYKMVILLRERAIFFSRSSEKISDGEIQSRK